MTRVGADLAKRVIQGAKQPTGQISRHNLRMHAHAKLTNPLVPHSPALGAALQSNQVFLPRLSPLPTTAIVARRINAIR